MRAVRIRPTTVEAERNRRVMKRPMPSDRPVREAVGRLAGFNDDRERLLAEVERRVVGKRLADAERVGDHSLEYVLNDVCYSEIRRLEAAGDKRRREAERWRDLAGRLRHMTERQKRDELRRLVAHYGKDVVGNFNPRVFRFASEILPPALSFLFSPVSGVRDGVAALGQLDARIQVEGELEAARAVADRGTIVVTPTHSSNMDSVVIGFALIRALLPPVTYGAGKNLFTNPFISFFMRNLGAYRVDRRLRFELYKDVLKEYSTVLLEHGYHSLFFPGGTRCRSNIVEKNLKLGLLGTAVTAYRNNVRAGAPQKRIYVVPATINYRLVLEAETLIGDFLAETGKNRYIITDDEFSRLGRIVEFVRKMLVHEGSLVMRFGRPLDVFGNDVDDAGESLDRAGRIVDPSNYVRGADAVVIDDDQRDAEYTRMLGKRIGDVFPRETVLHSTHLAARAIHDLVSRAAGTRDIYRLLRAPAEVLTVPASAVEAGVARLVARIAAEPGYGHVHTQLSIMTPAAIVDDAVRGLGSYHTRPVVERRGDDVVVGDVKLLYYYQNRTHHIPVEAVASVPADARRAATVDA
jgi:glycerol-3-phosphate O-acyltransferase